MQKLKIDKVEALQMLYLRDHFIFPIKKIAGIFNKSPNYVTSRITYARNYLVKYH